MNDPTAQKPAVNRLDGPVAEPVAAAYRECIKASQRVLAAGVDAIAARFPNKTRRLNDEIAGGAFPAVEVDLATLKITALIIHPTGRREIFFEFDGSAFHGQSH